MIHTELSENNRATLKDWHEDLSMVGSLHRKGKCQMEIGKIIFALLCTALQYPECWDWEILELVDKQENCMLFVQSIAKIIQLSSSAFIK